MVFKKSISSSAHLVRTLLEREEQSAIDGVGEHAVFDVFESETTGEQRCELVKFTDVVAVTGGSSFVSSAK